MVYLVVGVIVSGFLYHIFMRLCRIRINRSDEKVKIEFRDNVTKLITDFNRVSNTNINILEDKIEDLNRTIELADQRIIKLNLLINDLQIMANKCERVLGNKGLSPHTDASLEPISQDQGGSSKYNKIYELASGGSSIEDIAKSVDMSKGEVKLVLGLKGRGR
ncbi:MAG: hypothetical protein QME40_00210 [bacterium]|nr:hypothetical protein [bacterium]